MSQSYIKVFSLSSYASSRFSALNPMDTLMTMLPSVIDRSFELSETDPQHGLWHFLQQALHAPILTAEEELQLAARLRDHNDVKAAHKLVASHLRLVFKIARDYQGYHLNLQDLIQEGTIGLMHAVKRFDPERGVRLSTYAVWWIRAAIHEFILNSWRMVKIATTQIKRQLFFKLRQSKSSLAPLTSEEADELALKFGTNRKNILEMDSRMNGFDSSLNQELVEDGGDLIHQIPDDRPNQEVAAISMQQQRLGTTLIRQGMQTLDPRERQVITERYLLPQPKTLEAIGTTLAVSRERVRQLEKRALEKMRLFFLQSPEGRELALEA
ncbi:MAG: RNA polymerase factor sigma-32 [Magnetococcus sp. DMHC-6]